VRFRAISLTLVAFVALATALQSTRAQDTPWNRRLRTDVVLNDSPAVRSAGRKGPLTAEEMRRLGLRPRGGGLIDLSYWPEEPAVPSRVLAKDLAAAMAQLCPATTSASELATYTQAIVRYAEEFSVDAWTLAALVYTQSNCNHEINNSYGAGLTLINPGMHAANVRGGIYRFGVWTDEGWTRKELDVSAFQFHREALVRSDPNIYFAAAILSVFAQQCPHIDRAFDSAPHRHAVSHFVWGDRVGDTGPEDRILTARRRLLSHHARLNRGNGRLHGISFVSPLDGYPRIATSGLGEPRDNGRRPHRGIDLASEEGEPVRSIADGTVTFAGVDWERRALIPLEPWGAVIVHERHMGPRGLFVEVDHGNGVVSHYAHLASYDVQIGDQIDAGQRLGEVGRTGIKDSGPHLHFGLFHEGKVLDPLEYLAEYVFPPSLTKRGYAELTKQHRRSRRQRRSSARN